MRDLVPLNIRKYEDDEEKEKEKEEDSSFECPICYEMMTPPKKIYQCAEGHLVCSECKPKIPNNNCATCQSGQGYISRCRWIEERIARKSTKRVKPNSNGEDDSALTVTSLSERPMECEVRISLSNYLLQLGIPLQRSLYVANQQTVEMQKKNLTLKDPQVLSERNLLRHTCRQVEAAN